MTRFWRSIWGWAGGCQCVAMHMRRECRGGLTLFATHQLPQHHHPSSIAGHEVLQAAFPMGNLVLSRGVRGP